MRALIRLDKEQQEKLAALRRDIAESASTSSIAAKVSTASGFSPNCWTKSRSASHGHASLSSLPRRGRTFRRSADYIAKDDPQAARRVVMRLRDMARMLAGAPAMGRARPELGTNIRSFVADRYVLFYRPLTGAAGIELVRVLHGARDVDAIFCGR